MKVFRLTILLASLLSLLSGHALVYPEGIENPLDSDITENVRFVTYECKDARFAEIVYEGCLYRDSFPVSMKAIYCDDGTVYLNQFLNSITLTTKTRGSREYWIKGRLSDDGKYINIPVGQIAAVYPYAKSQYYYPVIFSPTGYMADIKVDDSADMISLRIEEDGTLTTIGIDDTHGWGCLQEDDKSFYRILFCDAFVPNEAQPVLPPHGLKKIVYDFKFATFEGLVKFGDIGKRVNVVFHNDSIFIQGCSYDNSEGWSVGVKDGNTFVFGNGKQPLKNVCLNAVDYTAYGDWASAVNVIDEDVIFDTDPTSGRLIPRCNFWLYGSSGGMGYTQGSLDNVYGDNDVFISPVFQKIPDGPQHPVPPDVKVEEESNGKCWITVVGSYFDSNGFVMDVNELFYRLYIDGVPYTFSKIGRWFSFDVKPSELLPYRILYVDREGKDIPRQYSFDVEIPSTFREVRAELVYIQDGQEISSGVNAVYDDQESCRRSEDVFDLTGTKVNPDFLLPGIYIKRGQKFVVR